MSIDFKDIAYRETETKRMQQKVIEPAGAKRHVVRINSIEAQRKQFKRQTTMKSKELIRVPVDSIAVFCSEHIPGHFPNEKYVTYVLTVNGIDYEIEPVNSQRAGKKIIRHSDIDSDQPYAIYIEESIKSAFLTIVISAHGRTETPYLSNVKILYGRKES